MSKETRNLYVTTHTETYYNKKNLFCGRINSRLTPEGIKQAKKLAQQLKNKKIDIAFTSSLKRTKDTLAYILKYHPNTKIIVDDRLIERDYGDLTRKSKAKYARAHPDLYPIYHRSYDVPPPGGESIKQVEARVRSFLKDLINLIKKEKVNVLIVCHGNSVRPIRRWFEKLTPKQMMKLETHNHKIYHYKIKV
jgi:2,3-bisphosphoglycerate-dependent phosphoglycerate mutase